MGIPTKEVELYTMDTISIEFPAVKVNLPVDDITFDSLEQMVFDITQRIGRKTIEKTLLDIDNALKESRPKRTLENTGKREKYFLTRLGDIRYERTRYIDKATGKNRYLLDEKSENSKEKKFIKPDWLKPEISAPYAGTIAINDPARVMEKIIVLLKTKTRSSL